MLLVELPGISNHRKCSWDSRGSWSTRDWDGDVELVPGPTWPGETCSYLDYLSSRAVIIKFIIKTCGELSIKSFPERLTADDVRNEKRHIFLS